MLTAKSKSFSKLIVSSCVKCKLPFFFPLKAKLTIDNHVGSLFLSKPKMSNDKNVAFHIADIKMQHFPTAPIGKCNRSQY
jgi:hypothetical protein